MVIRVVTCGNPGVNIVNTPMVQVINSAGVIIVVICGTISHRKTSDNSVGESGDIYLLVKYTGIHWVTILISRSSGMPWFVEVSFPHSVEEH